MSTDLDITLSPDERLSRANDARQDTLRTIGDLTASVQLIDEQLLALTAKRQLAQQRVMELQEAARGLPTQIAHAAGQARIMVGTLLEERTAAEEARLRAELATTQADLAIALRHAADTEATCDAERVRLQAEREDALAEATELQALEYELRLQSAAAHEDIGKARLTEYLNTWRALKERASDAEAALRAQETEMIRELAAWPDLQREARKIAPGAFSPTYTLVAAFRAYLDAMEAAPFPPTVAGGSLPQLFDVPMNHLSYALMRGQDYLNPIRQKRGLVDAICGHLLNGGE